MTRDEAREYLLDISNSVGTTDSEFWTLKDANKMREAISVLSSYKKGDVVDTTFGTDALILYGECIREEWFYRVQLLNWIPKQIEKMGGPKEAWIIISENQIVGLKEDQNEND